MKRLEQAALHAARQQREKSARLAAAGVEDDRRSKQAGALQRAAERMTGRNTAVLPLHRGRIAQTAEPRQTFAPVEREKPFDTRIMQATDPADFTHNYLQRTMGGMLENAYNYRAGKTDRESGADLYRLTDQKKKLTGNLQQVENNIAKMEEFHRQNGMYEDQMAYDGQVAARDSLQQQLAGLDSELGEVQAKYDALEKSRPAWAEPQGLDQYMDSYGQYSESYPGFSGYNAENPYDAGLASPMTEQQTRLRMAEDAQNLPTQINALQSRIKQYEQAGMGGERNVKNMRKQLKALQDQQSMLAYTNLQSNDDFRSVVDDAKANGLTQGTKYQDILEAVLDPEAYVKKNFVVSSLPFSPYYGPRNTAKYLTENERDRFIYLWQTQGEDAANEFFESMIPVGNQRFADAVNKAGEVIGEKMPVAGMAINTLGSVASAPSNLLGLAETGLNSLTGEMTDPYGQNFVWHKASSGLQSGSRQAVVEPFMKDGQETTASKLAGLGYDAITTTVDNLAQALAYGPLAPVVMALGSASDTTADSLIRNGGESTQALLNGLAAGAAEYLTEKIPMDQLGEMLKGNSRGWRAVLMQGATEAPGEMLSTILSEVGDREIMQAYSNYERSVAALMASDPSLSRAEAERIATKDFWKEVGYSGALGWLSGSGSASVAQLLGSGATTQPMDGSVEGRVAAEQFPTVQAREAEASVPVEQQMVPEQVVQEQQSEELPPEAAGMPGVEEALPSAEQLPDMQMPEMEGVQDEAMPEAEEGQRPYNSREEIGRRFRERAKPLVEQSRDLWQRIQQIEDPVTRTLKELAYMQLFRPMWLDSVNEQYYIDYPHRRPDPEVENRKVQERLAQKPPVLLQAAYDMVRGQQRYGAGQQGYGNMPVVAENQLRSGQMPVVPESWQRNGNMPIVPVNQQRNGQMPVSQGNQQMPDTTREEIIRRFRKLAAPLLEQNRGFWNAIQQTDDPTKRKQMETEYLRIFQPVWEMAVNGEDSQHRSTVQQKATVGSDQTGRGIAKAGKAMPNSLQLMSADADTAGVAGISAEDAVSEKEKLQIVEKREASSKLDNSKENGKMIAGNHIAVQAPISQSYVDALHSGGKACILGNVHCVVVEKDYDFSDGNNGVKRTAKAIIYITADGTRFVYPKFCSRKKQSLSPDDAIAAWYHVPENIRQRIQNTIEIVDYYNPQDEYWRKTYKNFSHSYASAGDKITLWRAHIHDFDYLKITYCHEGGHYLDYTLPGMRNQKGWRYSEQHEWQNAMAADLKTSGKKSWRGYGENSPLEDFADSVAFFTFAHAQFVATFPARSKLLANILK